MSDGDPWGPVTTAFHQLLLDLSIPHEFHLLPGPHDDEYGIANLGRYLAFYSRALLHEPSGG